MGSLALPLALLAPPSGPHRDSRVENPRHFTARPDFWPRADRLGLESYGHVAAGDLSSPGVLILPNSKGSIHAGRPSDRDRLTVTGGGAYPGDTCPASTSATLSWPSRPQPSWLSGYDVFRKNGGDGTPIVVGRTFNGGACFAGNISQPAAVGTTLSVQDAACPDPGQSYYYLVGHSSPDAAQRPPVGVTSTQDGYSASSSCP